MTSQRYVYFTEIGGIMEGPFQCDEAGRTELIDAFKVDYFDCEPGYANLTILDFGEPGVPAYTEECVTNAKERT